MMTPEIAVGLDIKRAAEILASDEYAAEVREQEQLWTSRGVTPRLRMASAVAATQILLFSESCMLLFLDREDIGVMGGARGAPRMSS